MLDLAVSSRGAAACDSRAQYVRASCSNLDERWRRGDAQCVRDVLRAYSREFTARLARRHRLVLGIDEVEALVSAAIWHAWRRRVQFTPARGALAAWLWKISRRKVATEAARRQRLLHGCLTATNDQLARTAWPTQAEDEREEYVSRLLDQALAALSDKERRILRADAESPSGLAEADLRAKDLGISEKTVRCYRSRGHAKMKAELARLGYSGAPGKG